MTPLVLTRVPHQWFYPGVAAFERMAGYHEDPAPSVSILMGTGIDPMYTSSVSIH